MSQVPQIRIPATYLRGGTSKGVFFRSRTCPKPPASRAVRATSCCSA
jgi:2-methylaconitate cis-trans-isomerase PrpF